MGRQLTATELKSETDFSPGTFVPLIKNGERVPTGHPTTDDVPDMQANPLMPETSANMRSITGHPTYTNNFQRNEP